MASQAHHYTPQYNQSWALIVGVDQYRNLPPLRTAVNGAQAISGYFRDQLGFEVTELYDGDATRESILRWFGQLNPHPDDRVVFYYAGHGVTQSLRNRSKGYLALANSEGYWDSLAMDDILDEADALPAKHVLYLLDACFSGIALRGRDADFGVRRTVDYLLTRPARYAITAGGEEVVDDAAAGDYSLYTYWLLQAFDDKKLQADGMLRAKELGLYIEENVSAHRHSRALPNHGYLQGSGDGDFLFAWDAGPRLRVDLEMALDSTLAEVRWGAVAAIINIAKEGDDQLAQVARDRLETLSRMDDDPRVRAAAQSLFEEEEAIRLAEEQRIRDEEARQRLEEARQKQEEAARIAREAEESLQAAQRRAEEERLLAEQAEQERHEALQAALERRQIVSAPPAREIPVEQEPEEVEAPEEVRSPTEKRIVPKKRLPTWAWGVIGVVLVAGIVGVLALLGVFAGEGTSTSTSFPTSEIVPGTRIKEYHDFDYTRTDWEFSYNVKLEDGIAVISSSPWWTGVFTDQDLQAGQTVLVTYQFEPDTVGEILVESGTYQTSSYRAWGVQNWDGDIKPAKTIGEVDSNLYWDNMVSAVDAEAGQWYAIAIYIGSDDEDFRIRLWPLDNPSRIMTATDSLDIPASTEWWNTKMVNGESGTSMIDRWEVVNGWPW